MEIRTVEDAAKLLESVHHFHDGYIQTVILSSEDRFDISEPTLQGIGHLCTGAFRAELIFVHHPTIAGLPPRRKTSRCTFLEVRNFRLDLRHFQEVEWAIQDVRIDSDSAGSRLNLRCTWPRLSFNGQWTTRTEHLFSFSRAFVEEECP